MAGNGYDYDSATYSVEGQVFQVNYASKAVEASNTAIGVCCKDGVVVGIEKTLLSKLLEPGTNRRCLGIDRQAGMCVCGMLPDGKLVADRARNEASSYRDFYATPITGSVLTDRVASFMHWFTLRAGIRPLGVAVILASYADDGPQLYMVDPSGTSCGYKACATGKAKAVAKTELEKIDFDQITAREAVKKISDILYQVHDPSKDKLFEMEFAWVCDESNRVFQRVPQDVVPPAPEPKEKKASS